MNFRRYHESKNLFDKDNTTIYNAYIGNDGRWITISDGSKSIKMPVDSSTQYTLSISEPNTVFRIYETSNSNPEPSARGLNLSEIVRSTNISQYTFTTSSDTKYIVFQASGSTINSWFNSLMLNTGSTALPYEPYSSEVWHDIPYYIRKTDTDTFTTLPADIYADGTNATVNLKGNMVQTGTPSPTTPIQPQETGERTGNLMPYATAQTITNNGVTFASDGQGRYHIYGKAVDNTAIAKFSIPAFTTPISVGNGGSGTLSFFNTRGRSTGIRVIFYNGNTMIDGWNMTIVNRTHNTYNTLGDKYVDAIQFEIGTGFDVDMYISPEFTNDGEYPSEYEPYGYKLPISSNSVTTNVYLGEVQTTRNIQKLVLTGEEEWKSPLSDNTKFYLDTITPDYLRANSQVTYLCTHYIPYEQTTSASLVPNLNMSMSSESAQRLYISDNNYTTVEDFKAYLAQQYAAGTPVCVWYVLATPTTGIVNEPLRKIGDYADTLSNVSIPTVDGANTIDVLTTLKPSEVSATFHGWHPVSAVHEKSKNLWSDIPSSPNTSLNQNTGEEVANNEFDTYTIAITPSTTYTVAFSYGSGAGTRKASVHQYNGDTWISALAIDDNRLYPKTVTTGSSATKIKISILKDTSNRRCNVGETALPYEPYWK